MSTQRLDLQAALATARERLCQVAEQYTADELDQSEYTAEQALRFAAEEYAEALWAWQERP